MGYMSQRQLGKRRSPYYWKTYDVSPLEILLARPDQGWQAEMAQEPRKSEGLQARVIKYEDDLSITFSEIDELKRCDNEEDGDYIFKPSDYSENFVKDLLSSTYKLLSFSPPLPSVSSDGDGGLRIEWEKNNRDLRLVCPSKEEKEKYIYFEDGDESKIEKNIDEKTLASLLQWLNNA